jgi:hypothetical protein
MAQGLLDAPLSRGMTVKKDVVSEPDSGGGVSPAESARRGART